MAEEVGERASGGDEVSKGVVCVLGDGVSAGVEVSSYVAVVVVARDVDRAVDCAIEKPSDTSRALQRTGKILAPVVVARRCRSVGVCDALRRRVQRAVA